MSTRTRKQFMHLSQRQKRRRLLEQRNFGNESNLNINNANSKPFTFTANKVMQDFSNLNNSDGGSHVNFEACTSSQAINDISFSTTLCATSAPDLSYLSNNSFRAVPEKSPLNFETEFRNLVIKHKISHHFVNELLVLLKNNGHSELPVDSRTLLKTPRNTQEKISEMSGGHYVHFGLEAMLAYSLKFYNYQNDQVFVNFNIDGLPISKSSSAQFWPILGAIVIENQYTEPFIIGVFYGLTKPTHANEYLSPLCSEAKHLLEKGLYVNNKHISFHINAFICDAPARAFITSTKNHSGYFGCSKCTTEGSFEENRVVFPEINAKLRTDESFYKESKEYQEEHHKDKSILQDLNVGMVTQVPLDYMHLVCLGVVKRLIQFWIKGKKNIRLNDVDIETVNRMYVSFAKSLPCEFARAPRSLSEVDRWKATEFRLFVLYGGVVVLKGLLKKQYYQHFLCLSAAMRILCNEELIKHYFENAKKLLIYFVQKYSDLYGQHFVSYNVHNLIHLCDDVKKFGVLDNFSAFKYENYMYKIKKSIKTSPNPLQQIYNRTVEKVQLDVLALPQNDPKYKVGKDGKIESVNFINFKLTCREPDNCCILQNGNIVKIRNIYKNASNIQICVDVYTKREKLFDKPCDSSTFKIFAVSSNFIEQSELLITTIKSKCVLFNITDNTSAVFPILHTDNQ